MPRKPDLKVLQRILSFITPTYTTLNDKKVFAIFTGLALFLRFPFFFRDYIDRDESTFILVAQSWVDGFLPYTQLWDLKPPITFLFFAVIIKIFGKSFLAIRVFGSLLVASTAFFTYKIGNKAASKRVGFWSAILCVALQSMFGSVQGVMSEHISIAFFCAALYFLLSKQSVFWYALSGILMGLSIMSKLNMVYPAFFLGVFFMLEGLKNKDFKNILPKLVFWVLGMIVLILMTSIPYYFTNEFNTWWQSVFMAPLSYSSTKTNSILNVLPFCLILFTLFAVLFRLKLLNIKQRKVQLLLAVSLGIVISFLQAGKINGHYLIQLYPFLLILIGIALYKFKLPQKFKIAPILFFISLLLPFETYSEYVNIIKNKINTGTFYNGEGFTIPKYIQENQLETKNIFFTEYHIGYWLLDKTPVTKVATHPSNIGRQELFPSMENPRKTSIQELQYILEDLKPKTIVTRKNKSVYNKEYSMLNEYINGYLLEHYEQVTTVDKGAIYQRLE